MTENVYPPTTSLPLDPNAAYPTEPATSVRTRQGQHPDNATGHVTPERPRRHPVAYAALILSIIALLWLAIWSSMSSNDGNRFQRVRVGTQDCVSVPQNSGPAGLYCRTDGITK
ncbi:MAG: hypothetical protein JWO12_548 [Frankiales bacterium]|nr:hypothetical protein [Frankiales bacterium]